MARLITEDRTLRDACIEPCPNEAIPAGDDICVIDAFKCTEFVGHHDEPQCKLVCPTDAST